MKKFLRWAIPFVSILILSSGVLAMTGGIAFEVARALAATAKTAPPLPTTEAAASINALGGIGRDTTWCEDIGTSAENLWVSANVPSELSTAAARSLLRWVLVQHIGNGADATADEVAICVRQGPATDSPALSCSLGASVNGMPLLSKNSTKLLEIRPITTEGTASNAVVPIWAMAASAPADPPRLCVTVGW